ncbi:hypothetical protein LA76x_3867 [Lysobacter antibioticus]|uniref:Uncharacterized protein n=1 Tax=Lysobacter antibioticus TaxID=84531 RepID=A0A0S2FEP3_LYSAN|nr:hypothetical protein LA76x_3867 [Lysobacter antibioticus]
MATGRAARFGFRPWNSWHVLLGFPGIAVKGIRRGNLFGPVRRKTAGNKKAPLRVLCSGVASIGRLHRPGTEDHRRQAHPARALALGLQRYQ